MVCIACEGRQSSFLNDIIGFSACAETDIAIDTAKIK